MSEREESRKASALTAWATREIHLSDIEMGRIVGGASFQKKKSIIHVWTYIFLIFKLNFIEA